LTAPFVGLFVIGYT